MNPTRIIGAVDIGSDQTVAVIGELSDSRLRLAGWSRAETQGVTQGMICHYSACCDVVNCTIQNAINLARMRPESFWFTQRGAHLAGFRTEAAVNIRAPASLIGHTDIEAVCHIARMKQLADDRTVIQRLRGLFRVDDRPVPHSPERLAGRRLAVDYWTVHGDLEEVSAQVHMVLKSGIEVRELIVGGIAAGAAVTNAAERSDGVLVLDIGRNTVDYALFYAGLILLAGSVAHPGGHEALLWAVRQCLGEFAPAEFCSCGVVLTGGAPTLGACREVAERVFCVTAGIAEPPLWAGADEGLRRPACSAALGLLRLAAEK